MKNYKVLLSCVAALTFTANAQEQIDDIDVAQTKEQEAPAKETSPDNERGGFYTGLNAGMSMNKYKLKSADSSKNFSNDPNGYVLEAFIGYDKSFGKFVVGADFGIGMNFSGKLHFKPSDYMTSDEISAYNTQNPDEKITDTSASNLRHRYTFSLIPRVGYLITPEFELFLNAGASINNYKVTTGVGKASGTSKTNFSPVAGFGAKYDFSNTMFATVSYNIAFNTTIYTFKNTTKTTSMKNNTQTIKLGLGIRL